MATATDSRKYTLFIHDPITRKRMTLAIGLTKKQVDTYINTMNREFTPVTEEED